MRLESVISVTGKVVARAPETVNPALPTGEVEVAVDELDGAVDGRARCRSRCGHAGRVPEEQRLRYRFLDLRREKLHAQHRAARRR